MYTRITTSGGRSNLQLVEGHRDAQREARIRVVANLGRLDRLNPAKLDPLICRLNRAVGRLENTAYEITHEPARAFGDVFALHELRKELDIERALARPQGPPQGPVEAEVFPELVQGEVRPCIHVHLISICPVRGRRVSRAQIACAICARRRGYGSSCGSRSALRPAAAPVCLSPALTAPFRVRPAAAVAGSATRRHRQHPPGPLPSTPHDLS